MSVVLSEHMPLLATAPDGVQKLRGLILDLAVRGKLVPQDPNDEPARELLKRIAKKRARLEAEGVCKKSKAMPPVGDSEQPFALPNGWEWVRVANFGETQTGTTPSKSQPSLFGSDVPFIKPGDISDQGINYENEGLSSEGVANSGRLAFAGSVLMVCIGTIGKCGVIDRSCSFNQQINSISPVAETSPFVFTAMRSNYFQSEAWSRSSSTTIAILNKGNWEAIPLPLPPLDEQHRIVAKVDELMTLCDRLEAEQADAASAHVRLVETLLGTLTQSTDAAELAANWQRLADHFDTLFVSESSLDALKQTVRQLAVTGKLVPQEPLDEPASELVKRIAKERAQLEADGVCKKSKLTPPVDNENMYPLPNNWQWSALDPLVRVMDSGWSPACIETPSPSDDVWGVLKTTAVQTFQYLEFENKELPSHLAPRPECEVAVGDILITRAGPKNRVAISCLVEATRPRLMISDKIIRFHLVEGGMYEKFVALCLNAGATATYLETAKSGMAVSQMNITQEKLRMAPIPICSTAEQHRIVAKVDELMTLCDHLKADLIKARQQQAKLATTLIETSLETA